MPILSASQLETLASRIFSAVGAPQDVADHVARSLVLSNLVGHDSHGVLRIPTYLAAVETGAVLPAARPTVREETATTAVVDGNWAFGQITAHHAMKVATDKARSANVAAVSAIRCNHIGRLGEYTEMAAREGMVAFMVGATFSSGGTVTPYGGAGRVLGSNPLCFAVPGGGDEPIVADIATSVTAVGKVEVARAKREQLGPGILVDRDGNPTTDPNDFFDGGMLLPVGGHKGYALSVIVDLLGKYMAAGERLVTSEVSFGKFIVVVNVEAFRPLADFQAATAGRLAQVKGVRPAAGFGEVLLPGEPERRALAQRTREGIALPEDTYARLSQIAAKLGVRMPEAGGD